MVVFPWLVLIVLTLAASATLLTLAARLWARQRHTEPPFAAGLLSSIAVALPLLLVILAWGILIKPR